LHAPRRPLWMVRCSLGNCADPSPARLTVHCTADQAQCCTLWADCCSDSASPCSSPPSTQMASPTSPIGQCANNHTRAPLNPPQPPSAPASARRPCRAGVPHAPPGQCRARLLGRRRLRLDTPCSRHPSIRSRDPAPVRHLHAHATLSRAPGSAAGNRTFLHRGHTLKSRTVCRRVATSIHLKWSQQRQAVGLVRIPGSCRTPDVPTCTIACLHLQETFFNLRGKRMR
jgi:hypothetical protein